MQIDIAQAKFQAGVAQSLAEEAMDKVEQMNDNIKNIEESILTRSQIQEMIDTSLQEFKGKTAPFVSAQLRKGPNTFINDIKNVQADEKFSRTAVIGGFPQDTARNDIIKFIDSNIVKETDPNIDEVFAYKFGSIGFVRFQTTSQMWDFIKKQNSKPKSKYEGREVWVAVSKSLSERKKGRTLSKYKRVFIEAGISDSDDIRIDYNRGILMLKKIRVAEWDHDAERLILKSEKLREAGVQVEAEMLENAYKELTKE